MDWMILVCGREFLRFPIDRMLTATLDGSQDAGPGAPSWTPARSAWRRIVEDLPDGRRQDEQVCRLEVKLKILEELEETETIPQNVRVFFWTSLIGTMKYFQHPPYRCVFAQRLHIKRLLGRTDWAQFDQLCWACNSHFKASWCPNVESFLSSLCFMFVWLTNSLTNHCL